MRHQKKLCHHDDLAVNVNDAAPWFVPDRMPDMILWLFSTVSACQLLFIILDKFDNSFVKHFLQKVSLVGVVGKTDLKSSKPREF